ncbi:polysaccharide deacetylase family protein [Streptomyces winkii]|uniref:polysaccharide deacetylase family protein n=1 Tax=Streptomyces winkii TaxID=3051178 RepID=UPI0028D0BF87|nr:polysaccharide deacetylase [Streptomyces sp. DSM 40971]
MTAGYVCVTFDFDALSGWMARGQLSATPRSRGEFAAVGAERLLHTLARRDLVSTWFVPGHTALTYPGLTREIAAAGHEVAVHGHAHENVAALPVEEERAVLQRSLAAVESVTGRRPRGFRAPAWDLSDDSVVLLVEHGLAYDSSLMGHDYAPYRCRTSDEVHQDGVRWGERTDLVELPVSWSLDDYPYFEFQRTPSGVLPGLRAPAEMFGNWSDDLDYMLRDIHRGVLTVTMHPEVIGRGHRLLALERWLDRLAELDVEVTTCERITELVRAGEELGGYRPA